MFEYNGNSGAHSVNEPLPTIPTHDRFGLVQPALNGRCLDVRFRMLQPHELAGAMGFPREYKFCGTKTEITRQIGRPAVLTSPYSSLGGDTNMAKCARCGIDIERPMKEWNMQPRDGRGPALHVKHYACPQCGKTFRIADKLIGPETKSP